MHTDNQGQIRESLPNMNPMSRDVTRALTGGAHADAEPNAKDAARRYSTGLRTQYNHQKEGAPEMRAAQMFLFRSAFPARHAASLMALAQRIELEGRTESEVIELYHATLAEEKAAEQADTCLDLSRSACWLDKARQTERDMALEARKAGCERWFAEHRVSPAKVWAR